MEDTDLRNSNHITGIPTKSTNSAIMVHKEMHAQIGGKWTLLQITTNGSTVLTNHSSGFI